MITRQNRTLKPYIGYGRVRYADSRVKRRRSARRRHSEYVATKSFDYFNIFARKTMEYFDGKAKGFSGPRDMVRKWEDIMDDIFDKMIPKFIRDSQSLLSKSASKGRSVDHGDAKKLGKLDEDIMDAFADWLDEYEKSDIEQYFPTDSWADEVFLRMKGAWVSYMRRVRYIMVEELRLGNEDDVERVWKKHIRKYKLKLPEYDWFKSTKFVSQDI